jgi:hypothetical protein
MARIQQRMERMKAATERWGGARGYRTPPGNRAFDEYRAETLRRLEEEQREFMEFLNDCATPRTKRNSTSSWSSAAVAQRARGRRHKASDRRSFPPHAGGREG